MSYNMLSEQEIQNIWVICWTDVEREGCPVAGMFPVKKKRISVTFKQLVSAHKRKKEVTKCCVAALLLLSTLQDANLDFEVPPWLGNNPFKPRTSYTGRTERILLSYPIRHAEEKLCFKCIPQKHSKWLVRRWNSISACESQLWVLSACHSFFGKWISERNVSAFLSPLTQVHIECSWDGCDFNSGFFPNWFIRFWQKSWNYSSQ